MVDNKITYLIGYTIKEKDAFRKKFKDLLENNEKLDVESVNESMYKTHHFPTIELKRDISVAPMVCQVEREAWPMPENMQDSSVPLYSFCQDRKRCFWAYCFPI